MTAEPKPRIPTCSICGEPMVEAYRPFCSARCANIDLARWLGGRYAIAGGTTDDEDEVARPSGPVDLDSGRADEEPPGKR